MQYARIVAVTGVLSLVTAVGVAEDTWHLAPGTRVRVEVSTEEKRLVGKLQAFDGKTLNLQVGDEMEPRILPREQITDLAVSEGRRWSRGRGALIGAGIGAVAGAAIGIATASESDPDAFAPNWSSGEGALGGAVLVGSIGALVGLAIPAGEKWKDVPLDSVRLSFRPVRGRGAGVFLTISF